MHLAPNWSETFHCSWAHVSVFLWYVIIINVILDFQSCTSHYNAGTWGIVQGQLRPLLAPRVYTLPMVRSIGKTMVQGKNYGPQITVKRISTRSVSHCASSFCVCCLFCCILSSTHSTVAHRCQCRTWFDRHSTTHFCNKQKKKRTERPDLNLRISHCWFSSHHLSASRNTFSSVMITYWLDWI